MGASPAWSLLHGQLTHIQCTIKCALSPRLSSFTRICYNSYVYIFGISEKIIGQHSSNVCNIRISIVPDALARPVCLNKCVLPNEGKLHLYLDTYAMIVTCFARRRAGSYRDHCSPSCTVRGGDQLSPGEGELEFIIKNIFQTTGCRGVQVGYSRDRIAGSSGRGKQCAGAPYNGGRSSDQAWSVRSLGCARHTIT